MPFYRIAIRPMCGLFFTYRHAVTFFLSVEYLEHIWDIAAMIVWMDLFDSTEISRLNYFKELIDLWFMIYLSFDFLLIIWLPNWMNSNIYYRQKGQIYLF